MVRAQSDTYSSMFNKSDNVKVVETFDKKTVCVHVLNYSKYLYMYVSISVGLID